MNDGRWQQHAASPGPPPQAPMINQPNGMFQGMPVPPPQLLQNNQILWQQQQLQNLHHRLVRLEGQPQQPARAGPAVIPQGSLEGLTNVLTIKYRPQRSGLFLNSLTLFYRNAFRFIIREIGMGNRAFNTAGFLVTVFLDMLTAAFNLRTGQNIRGVTVWVELERVVGGPGSLPHPDWQDAAHLGVVRQLHVINFVVASRACLLHDIANARCKNRRRSGGRLMAVVDRPNAEVPATIRQSHHQQAILKVQVVTTRQWKAAVP
ncbi:expressed unknown protein [Seminavis robusta]|uniref:Uncharacterized protein n=1 Tax=Seminavis robusta TaxID=568900 RepID=A0A9N8HS23_9STRA|nr:expressed unknown protein [Seminavis robusta]|eukprot:Sro1127_g244200.1 n/a (262) ;mRNA; r:20317-21102